MSWMAMAGLSSSAFAAASCPVRASAQTVQGGCDSSTDLNRGAQNRAPQRSEFAGSCHRSPGHHLCPTSAHPFGCTSPADKEMLRDCRTVVLFSPNCQKTRNHGDAILFRVFHSSPTPGGYRNCSGFLRRTPDWPASILTCTCWSIRPRCSCCRDQRNLFPAENPRNASSAMQSISVQGRPCEGKLLAGPVRCGRTIPRFRVVHSRPVLRRRGGQ